MRGDSSSTTIQLSKEAYNSCVEQLSTNDADSEPHRLVAAYTLARSEAGIHELLSLMYSTEDCVRRSAMYALGTVKSAELAAQLAVIMNSSKSPFIAGDALIALGWIGKGSAVCLPDIVKVCVTIPVA